MNPDGIRGWATLENQCPITMTMTSARNFLLFSYIDLYRNWGKNTLFCPVLFNSDDVLLQNR